MSGRYLSLINLSERLTAATIESFENFTLWYFSNSFMTPLIIVIHSSTEGSFTSIFWNLLAKAWFFENTFRYSWKVVDPMHRIFPLANSGLRRFDTSREPPPAEPAPMIVWISSMNKIGFFWDFKKLITSFILFSKSPLYLVPAISEAISRENIEKLWTDLGIEPL